MKILNARIHGILDILAIAGMFAAPSVVGFTGTAAALSYTLATLYVGLVLLTAYPYGLVKVIPFTIHGTMEFLISIGLMLSPYFIAMEGSASVFFRGAGVALFLVWLVTDYTSAHRLPYSGETIQVQRKEKITSPR